VAGFVDRSWVVVSGKLETNLVMVMSEL